LITFSIFQLCNLIFSYLKVNRDGTRYNKLPFIPISISAYKNKLFKIRFICSQIVLGVDEMSFSGSICYKNLKILVPDLTQCL